MGGPCGCVWIACPMGHSKVVLVRAHQERDVTARGVFAPPAGNRGKERCAECSTYACTVLGRRRNQGGCYISITVPG